MAFPQNAFDQIRREPNKAPAWSGRLLMFSATVLFVAVVAFLGLQFGYRPYLESRVEEHRQEAKRFAEQIPASKQEEVVTFYSQLSNLKTLLGKHTLPSNLLVFLEETTLSSLYFERAEYTGQTRELALNGRARSMTDIGTQMQLFQTNPKVERVTVKNIAADATNAWSFDIVLLMKP